MIKYLLMGVAAAALFGAPQANAATVVVENVGSILNQSMALPAEATPGGGTPFAQFFEFSLPTTESVTASVSDSGVGSLAVLGGVLTLNFHTTTGVGPLFIPAGALIESASFINTAGGQEATVGPQILNAGNYFVDVTGTSGSSPIHLAIDGTVTALATPEPSTWAMLGLGFGLMAFLGVRTKRKDRLSVAI
jgi:PEP-CTERM motif